MLLSKRQIYKDFFFQIFVVFSHYLNFNNPDKVPSTHDFIKNLADYCHVEIPFNFVLNDKKRDFLKIINFNSK